MPATSSPVVTLISPRICCLLPAAVASAARKRPRQTTLTECADLLIAKLPSSQLPLSPTPHSHSDGDDDNGDDGNHPLHRRSSKASAIARWSPVAVEMTLQRPLEWSLRAKARTKTSAFQYSQLTKTARIAGPKDLLKQLKPFLTQVKDIGTQVRSG
jgi:hypothetical protein